MADLVEQELERPEIQAVRVSEDGLSVDLKDGRAIITPLLWYPRLCYATEQERQHFQILRNVIYWPELDEEISVLGMLLGRIPSESQQSLQRWLTQRQEQHPVNGVVSH
ncbi:MAG: DUF2442 domain-containing protein [Caldilineaceae bacterium]